MRAFEYFEHTMLAGELTEPPAAPDAYRVRYRSLLGIERRHPLRTVLITVLCVLVEVAFVVWLLRPEHLPLPAARPALGAANLFLLAAIAVMEVMRMVNVFSLAAASLAVRNPIPVRPARDLRVAFATTVVPSKEPLEVVRRTLQAARAIDYPGPLHVWLLDEENDGSVRRICLELGVRHFTRKDVASWNQASGPYR